MDPVPDYVEEVREDPMAGPHHDDLLGDGSEDEMWVNLGVFLWLSDWITPSPCCN